MAISGWNGFLVAAMLSLLSFGLVLTSSCEEGSESSEKEEKAKEGEKQAMPTCVNIGKKTARLCCAPGQKSSIPKGFRPEVVAEAKFQQWCSLGGKDVSPYIIWKDQTKLDCGTDAVLTVAKWEEGEIWGTEHVCMQGKVKEGPTMRYHPSNERYEFTSYKAGKLDGKSKRWHLNGVREAEGVYVDGGRDGRWNHWDKADKKIREDDWKLGKRDGLSVAYWNNGVKRYEMPFTNDKVHGVWTEWWFEGQKQATGTKEHGVSVGLYTSWWGNGQESSKGERKGELACGVWECWNQKGEPRACFEGEAEGEFVGCKKSKTGAKCMACDKMVKEGE